MKSATAVSVRRKNMNFIRYDSPFARFMNRLVDIVVLGIITAVLCVPVITVGAAYSSLYYVTLKMVRGDDGNILRQYFDAFKQNFRKATCLWLIMLAVIVILYVDYTLLYSLDLNLEGASWVTLFIVTVVFALIGSYIFPLQAQFENPVFRTIKNAFILSIMNLPRSILILLVKLSPVAVFIFYPEALYILGFFCVAGLPYLSTEIFVKIFDKYIPRDEKELTEGEGDDEAALPVSATPVFADSALNEDEE